MKLMFVSDIHGSAYYTKKIIEKFYETKSDYLIILGDILYHGPRNDLPKEYDPKKVIKFLNSYADKIIAIKGNCDSEVDQMVLEFPIMAEYSNILYEGKRIFLSHGHKYKKDNYPKLENGDIFAFGHSHIPWLKYDNEIILFNPGSISLPKDNTDNSYGVIDDNYIKIFNLEGDLLNELKM